MKKIENECVSCGLPCIGKSCPYVDVPHYYCDRCNEEETLYYYGGLELCEECLLSEFEVVVGSEI